VIELIDDLEDRLLALLQWYMRLEQAPDAQVFVGPLAFWNQSIAGLLHSVVKEPIRAPRELYQLDTDRFPQIDVEFGDVPSTSASVATSALSPRHASNCNARRVCGGRRASLSNIRSATLSV
jgi:uncharacterized protein Usg